MSHWTIGQRWPGSRRLSQVPVQERQWMEIGTRLGQRLLWPYYRQRLFPLSASVCSSAAVVVLLLQFVRSTFALLYCYNYEILQALCYMCRVVSMHILMPVFDLLFLLFPSYHSTFDQRLLSRISFLPWNVWLSFPFQLFPLYHSTFGHRLLSRTSCFPCTINVRWAFILCVMTVLFPESRHFLLFSLRQGISKQTINNKVTGNIALKFYEQNLQTNNFYKIFMESGMNILLFH